MLKSKILTLILIAVGSVFVLRAQDPERFAKQIEEMLAKEGQTPASPIIFTGSSSVRMWSGLAADFPDRPVLNRGFGGSQMSDLLYYLDRLVIEDQPKQVFIYEGDNDISSGKTTEEILGDFKECYKRLRKALPDAEIVLISPKPSIARWELRAKYEALNVELAKMARRKKNLAFADVWTPMLNDKGEPMADIFIQDNLHMNARGYAIWKEVIGKMLR